MIKTVQVVEQAEWLMSRGSRTIVPRHPSLVVRYDPDSFREYVSEHAVSMAHSHLRFKSALHFSVRESPHSYELA